MAQIKELLLMVAIVGFFYHKEIHGQILLRPELKEFLHQTMDAMIARCEDKTQVPSPIDAAGIDKCLKEFNKLGLELKPEIDALRDILTKIERSWMYASSTEPEIVYEDDEFQKLLNEWELASYRASCKQITKGISCLSEFKEYFKSCGDEEGLTLPFIGQVVCSNDEQPLSVIKKFMSAKREDEICVRSDLDWLDSVESFRNVFLDCANKNGMMKLLNETRDVTGILSNTCSLSKNAYECYSKTFRKSCPGINSKLLEVADEFINATLNLANGEEEMVKETIKSCLPVPIN